MLPSSEEILGFWFYEVGEKRWFDSDPALDAVLRSRFTELYEKALAGALPDFQETPEGMLCLVLALDLFGRRMFRGTPRAFEGEDEARELARTAIIKHFDDRIDKSYKLIFYLPFMHSEHASEQRLALFYIRERTKDEAWISMAEEAFDEIERFGRFPERNEILGRETTPEERAFLEIRKSRS